jgi:hypothetical protein
LLLADWPPESQPAPKSSTAQARTVPEKKRILTSTDVTARPPRA